MEEVIARKSGIPLTYVSVLISFCVILLLGIVSTCVTKETAFITFIIFGASGTALLSWFINNFRKMPKVLLSLKDGELHFYDGFVCAVTDVEDVTITYAWRNRGIYNYGTLNVHLSDGIKAIEHVDAVDEALKKLVLIIKNHRD